MSAQILADMAAQPVSDKRLGAPEPASTAEFALWRERDYRDLAIEDAVACICDLERQRDHWRHEAELQHACCAKAYAEVRRLHDELRRREA